MTEHGLSPERFQALAETYGGDIARWPELCREQARALLAHDPEGLGAILAEASDLDHLLDLAPAGAVNAALLGRLIAAAPQPAGSARRWIAGLGAALGLGVAALAGVTAGVALGRAERPDRAKTEVIAAGFDTPDLYDALEEAGAI
ncbi:MAG: hypothetical protein KKC14_03875 [Alphaproteobacteria bacterium]|nr:hypothetical protein [Alphaproteobacteria bacterium]